MRGLNGAGIGIIDRGGATSSARSTTSPLSFLQNPAALATPGQLFDPNHDLIRLPFSICPDAHGGFVPFDWQLEKGSALHCSNFKGSGRCPEDDIKNGAYSRINL
jgi:hypothetical protein